MTGNRLISFGIVCLALALSASSALATPSRWDNNCASCHVDDTPSCDACHNHGNRGLSARTLQSSYAPGELIEVELSGGREGGWVRTVLYGPSDLEVDRTGGPTGTGNDGSFELELPTLLYTEAPSAPGTYTLNAAYHGNDDGAGHAEARIPLQVNIIGTASPVQVELAPVGLPIFIGATGGSLSYDGSVRNDSPNPVTFVVHTEVVLPSGGVYGPLLGPLSLTLPPGASGSMLVSHNVPRAAPRGLYTYRAVVKIQGTEADREVFRFVKD